MISKLVSASGKKLVSRREIVPSPAGFADLSRRVESSIASLSRFLGWQRDSLMGVAMIVKTIRRQRPGSGIERDSRQWFDLRTALADPGAQSPIAPSCSVPQRT